jgi:mono/diheme cytochrome c family protein
VLASVDKTLALVSWIAAAALALMLFVGPQVVAEDESKPTKEAAGAAPYAGGDTGGGGAEAADGKTVFTGNCGSCHTLAAAGTSGQVGPNLDDTSLGASDVEAIVREGRGGMPAFGGELSDAEIAAVAEFVAGSR